MIKTQIQLPDEMYRAAKALAARKEWSLAEVVRRGLETLLARFPSDVPSDQPWELPAARPLGGDPFFANPDWRYELHESRSLVLEGTSTQKPPPSKRRK